MFRHKENHPSATQQTSEEPVSQDASASPEVKAPLRNPATESDLRDLIEKNLKWSQIIYEQNRKLNSKLFWIAAAGWMKILIFILPLVAAILFLPPILKNVWSQYGDLLGWDEKTKSFNTSQAGQQTKSLENVLKLLNLDPAQEEKLKAILK